MSTLHLRCQRNATELLKSASEESKQMHLDMGEDAEFPDMDTVYSAAFEMRRFADRLNHFADQLMVEYRTMDWNQQEIDLDDLRNESYAN